jgi:antitoxin VapB
MTRITLLRSNGSQVLLLPEEVAFPASVRNGDRRIVTPTDGAWDDFFDEPGVDLGEGRFPSSVGRNDGK